MTPARSVYAQWWRDGAADHVSRFLMDSVKREGTVYVAAGLVDPSRPRDEHQQLNYFLARNVVEGATKLGFRVVTFGTVMEEVVGNKVTNPYFASKIRLGNFVDDFSTKSHLVLHIRIHTLFGGGLPARFMFLGQIFQSLMSHAEFKMSPGAQLREYHHLDDEVVAIKKLLESGVSGSVTLNHGAPVTLKNIASYIFEAFKCPELLRVGALPGPADDNYGMLFQRPRPLEGVTFRETLPALVDYLRACVVSSGRN
jgi:nucleoside-diphosphate-sugar epimerase